MSEEESRDSSTVSSTMDSEGRGFWTWTIVLCGRSCVEVGRFGEASSGCRLLLVSRCLGKRRKIWMVSLDVCTPYIVLPMPANFPLPPDYDVDKKA